MNSSVNLFCSTIDFSIRRIPWRILISRSMRRSSDDLNSDIYRSSSVAFGRGPVLFADAAIGLIERFAAVLDHAGVHLVPDIEHGLSGARNFVRGRFPGDLQHLVKALLVHLAGDVVVFNQLLERDEVFLADEA